jgi:hypothetical protein
VKGSLHNIMAFNSKKCKLNFKSQHQLSLCTPLHDLNIKWILFHFHLCEICYYLGLKTPFFQKLHMLCLASFNLSNKLQFSNQPKFCVQIGTSPLDTIAQNYFKSIHMFLSLFMMCQGFFLLLFKFILMPLLHTPTTNMTCQDIGTTHKYSYMFPIGNPIFNNLVACNVMIFLRSSFKGQQQSSILNM